MGRKLKNKRKKGHEIEKLAQRELEIKNFVTWRPAKVRFQSQDILRCFDIIAVSKKEMKLVQVQMERRRAFKRRAIDNLPHPKKISYEIWIWKSKENKFVKE